MCDECSACPKRCKDEGLECGRKVETIRSRNEFGVAVIFERTTCAKCGKFFGDKVVGEE